MRKLYALAMGAGAVVAGACGSSTSPNGGPVSGSSLTITAVGSSVCSGGGGAYGSTPSCNYYFTPTPDSVAVGSSVTFRYEDVKHEIVWDSPTHPGTADTVGTSGGESNTLIAVTAPTAGSFAYHCGIHPYMHGVMVVH